MARLYFAGAEIDGGVPANATQNTGPDGIRYGVASVTTRDTTTFRSGAAAYKFAVGANVGGITAFTVTRVASTNYYFRIYAKCAGAPATASRIMDVGSTAYSARLRTDGALEFLVSGVVQGSASAVMTDSNWHRIEISVNYDAGVNAVASELLLDGTSVATWTGSNVATAVLAFGWGAGGGANPGSGSDLFVDDVAINDSTGSANNSYPGSGNVLLLKPTADSAVGTGWTLGNGTAIASNGFGSVDNTPPVGIADLGGAGADTGQIRNANNTANTNYDATMTTYTAAGVTAGATVNAVQNWAATAAAASTSAKQGTIGNVSNPAISNIALASTGTSGAFWAGAAAATYGTGWKWSGGTLTETPSVTLGTAPVMRITQVTNSTRIAIVCGMFMYVDYSPAVAVARVPRNPAVNFNDPAFV